MARKILFWLSLVLMMIALYLVFVYVPTEKEMGIVQRIFYLMVPAGWPNWLVLKQTMSGFHCRTDS